MDKLRMGVLGCSHHYFKRIALPLRESRLVEPYAIASRSQAKAAAAVRDWDFKVAYASYEALLADPDLDFVYIPLPNHLHLEWIKKAADAGKPILCEKPLALNRPEAQEAVDYCKAKAVPLMEAFMYRFHPQWRRARDLIKTYEIGEIKAIHGVFGYNNRDPNNIRNIAEFGGGALLDIGCYAVSAARFLMAAEPKRVLCLLERDPVFGTDRLTSGILDFGEGRRALFSVGTQLSPIQRVEAFGSGGSLSLALPFNMFADVPARLTVTTELARRIIETEIADQYLLQFDEFARALIDGSQVPTPATDALANVAVLDALLASSKSASWEAVTDSR